MYPYLLFFHSITRWLVLISLIYTIYRAFRGWQRGLAFSPADDRARHITATISHIQFTLGAILYFVSPMVKYFLSNFKTAISNSEMSFFGLIHMSLMVTSVFVLSIGSSLAKRKEADKDKFKTMAIFYLIALIIILIAIPWPFSPFAHRPYYRPL